MRGNWREDRGTRLGRVNVSFGRKRERGVGELGNLWKGIHGRIGREGWMGGCIMLLEKILVM